MLTVQPEIRKLARAIDWRVTRSLEFEERRHINEQELVASLYELRESVERSLMPLRTMQAHENNVTMGCVAKGIAASLLLNVQLRRGCAWSILGQKEHSMFRAAW